MAVQCASATHNRANAAMASLGGTRQEFMFPLLDSMAEVWKKAPKAFLGNPIEEIENRIYLSPFYEEGIDDLINLIGVDQVLWVAT